MLLLLLAKGPRRSLQGQLQARVRQGLQDLRCASPLPPPLLRLRRCGLVSKMACLRDLPGCLFQAHHQKILESCCRQTKTPRCQSLACSKTTAQNNFQHLFHPKPEICETWSLNAALLAVQTSFDDANVERKCRVSEPAVAAQLWPEQRDVRQRAPSWSSADLRRVVFHSGQPLWSRA